MKINLFAYYSYQDEENRVSCIVAWPDGVLTSAQLDFL